MKKITMIVLMAITLYAHVNAQGPNKKVMIIDGLTLHVGDTVELLKPAGLNVYNSAWLKTSKLSKVANATAGGPSKYWIEEKYKGYKFLITKFDKSKARMVVKNPSLIYDVIIDVRKGFEDAEIKILYKN